MDANTLKNNWDSIRRELQSKFPDASSAIPSTAPSSTDSLVSSICQRTSRDEAAVRRDVESVVNNYS